jgi:hypothetical protein
MIRRRVAAVLLAAAIGQGCSIRPERTIVGDFFAASRSRDLTALSRFSTVVFEPRERGTIAEFTIRTVSAEHAEGDMLVKEVVVDAPLMTPDGGTAARTFVITLQRPRQVPAETSEAPLLYGGWIVTRVTDAPVPPPS